MERYSRCGLEIHGILCYIYREAVLGRTYNDIGTADRHLVLRVDHALQRWAWFCFALQLTPGDSWLEAARIVVSIDSGDSWLEAARIVTFGRSWCPQLNTPGLWLKVDGPAPHPSMS
jgi:hypothetical protein